MIDKLLCINGTWVTNPDTDSWAPTRYIEWTSGSGRTASGLSVGAIKYRKWKLPITWTYLDEDDEAQIEYLIENAGAFFPVKFYHRTGYIQCTMYASEVVPTGIIQTDTGIVYKKVTVSLVER